MALGRNWRQDTRVVTISIIVPAFNEEKLLPSTLESIQAASASFHSLGWETELILCDNNSSDRTAEVARRAGANVVFEPINQIARARNTGARAARGEWLIFIDADSHPTPGLFAEVANEIRSGRSVAGGVLVRMEGTHPVARQGVALWNLISRTLRYMAGSFIFCEAKAFRDTGGFNEELFASEEIDLSRKLKKLARRRGQRIAILRRHPLVTSGRKLHLYTPWEHLRFLAKTLLTAKRNLRRRDSCPTWYDGRR
jgi:glycosyltransferase involved in cell wall biosynthesis